MWNTTWAAGCWNRYNEGVEMEFLMEKEIDTVKTRVDILIIQMVIQI